MSTRRLLANQLILIIDQNGININPPKKSQTTFIEWKNIKGFSKIKIQGQKLVIINVNNSKYWIDREENMIRKKIMRFNVNNYDTPLNVSTISMKILINMDAMLNVSNRCATSFWVKLFRRHDTISFKPF